MSRPVDPTGCGDAPARRGVHKVAFDPDAPDRLDDRAFRARTERMAIRPLGRGRYEVEGESGGVYVVDIERSRCTCPDHGIRGARCKHLRRVAMELDAGWLPPPGSIVTLCAACDAETVAPEEAARPHLCPDCRLGPGEAVVDRVTGDLLIVAAVMDARADAVEVPGLGLTVAEYDANRAYPADDLVVRVVYPSSVRRALRRHAPLRTYAFPWSRLARLPSPR